MKIRLVRSGGFAGIRREARIDTETLDPARAEELCGIVHSAERAGLFRRGAGGPPAEHRDRFRYQLTVEDDRGTREAQFSEADAPETAALVVDAVWRASEA
jgi:hypothetical protein